MPDPGSGKSSLTSCQLEREQRSGQNLQGRAGLCTGLCVTVAAAGRKGGTDSPHGDHFGLCVGSVRGDFGLCWSTQGGRRELLACRGAHLRWVSVSPRPELPSWLGSAVSTPAAGRVRGYVEVSHWSTALGRAAHSLLLSPRSSFGLFFFCLCTFEMFYRNALELCVSFLRTVASRRLPAYLGGLCP